MVQPAPCSDKVIFGPKSINLKADNTKEALELKLESQNYIRCNALIKKLKHMKRYMYQYGFRVRIYNQRKAIVVAAAAAATTTEEDTPAEPIELDSL